MIRDELTYKVIGCAMRVHSTLGNCLAIELAEAGLEFAREKEQTLYYKTFEVGIRRADFIVENKIVVELKALSSLEDVHLAQAKNYLTAYRFPIGLLINFGGVSLEYKLIFNKNSQSSF